MTAHRALMLLAVLAALAVPSGCGLLGEEAVPAEPPVVIRAEVIRNTDGDTAVIQPDGGEPEAVRFIGIDTPEIGEGAEPLGVEAAAFTAETIPPGTVVWLETDAELRDRYDRLLAYVWLAEPTDGAAGEVRASMLNARLLLEGYASMDTVPPNVAYAGLFRELQAEARKDGLGVWSGAAQ